MRKNTIYHVFFFLLTLGALQAYQMFRFHFSGVEDYRLQVARLEEQLRQEKFRVALRGSELDAFRLHVAEQLPKTPENKEQRQIASIVRVPDKEINFSLRLFERARQEFKKEDYAKASETLQRYLRESKLSPHLIEAKFLLSESYFLTKKYNESLLLIEDMVTHHPENDLTGFVLLRLAQIHQIKDRKDDAIMVYKTVLKSFSNPELLQQANVLLSEIQGKGAL